MIMLVFIRYKKNNITQRTHILYFYTLFTIKKLLNKHKPEQSL